MECFICGGTCKVTCPSCHGSSVDAPRDDFWEACDRCFGEGEVKCPECKGVGVIGSDFQ
jgi:DnaJ-class molecular chaperone